MGSRDRYLRHVEQLPHKREIQSYITGTRHGNTLSLVDDSLQLAYPLYNSASALFAFWSQVPSHSRHGTSSIYRRQGPCESAGYTYGQEEFAKDWTSISWQKTGTRFFAGSPRPRAHFTHSNNSLSTGWKPVMLVGSPFKLSVSRTFATVGYACGQGKLAENWASKFWKTAWASCARFWALTTAVPAP